MLESLCKVVENCPCKQSTVKDAMEMFIKLRPTSVKQKAPQLQTWKVQPTTLEILGHFNASSAWHREQELLARFSVDSVWPSYRWPALATNIGLAMFQCLHCFCSRSIFKATIYEALSKPSFGGLESIIVPVIGRRQTFMKLMSGRSHRQWMDKPAPQMMHPLEIWHMPAIIDIATSHHHLSAILFMHLGGPRLQT